VNGNTTKKEVIMKLYGVFANLLGYYIGAFIYAFIVYNGSFVAVNFVTRYKLFKIKVIITSFILSIFLTVILTEVIYDWRIVLTHHIPMLILIFLINYRKTMYQKCPHCAERIKADAFKCKHCHSIVSSQEETSEINF
jgi:hypothetical protein